MLYLHSPEGNTRSDCATLSCAEAIRSDIQYNCHICGLMKGAHVIAVSMCLQSKARQLDALTDIAQHGLQQHMRNIYTVALNAKSTAPVPNVQSVFHHLGDLLVLSLSGGQAEPRHYKAAFGLTRKSGGRCESTSGQQTSSLPSRYPGQSRGYVRLCGAARWARPQPHSP